jgi:uncharacterized membrane protein
LALQCRIVKISQIWAKKTGTLFAQTPSCAVQVIEHINSPTAKEKKLAETLYATFIDASLAEKAVGALLDHGGRNEDISVISKTPGAHHVHETTVEDHGGQYVQPALVSDHVTDESAHVEKAGKQGLSTTTPGDARSGAAKGAGIGLGVGVAAAIASLIIPGFGLVMGGGALAVALAGTAGATAAGAVAGGVTGYLKDQGVPDARAADYHHAYENGSAVLSVHMPCGKLSREEVVSILSKYQASNVNTYGTLTN